MTDTRARWRPSARPGSRQADWRIDNALGVNDEAAQLYIYDAIDSWGGEWGVSASDVVTALVGVRASKIDVHLNSPGGDYFEGVAIRTALASHPAAITIYVDGLAASAASVIATVGERVVVAQGAQIMIHEAASRTIGTAEDMRAQADLLDKIGDDIARFYAQRAGGDPEHWRTAMRAETWYTADEAVAAGLADEVAGAPAEPAQTVGAAADRWILAAYRYAGRDEAPAPVPRAKAPDPVPEPTPDPDPVPPAFTFDPEKFRNTLKEAAK